MAAPFFPEELISDFFERLELEALKNCRRVCQKWCRIASPFLFDRVTYRNEQPQNFDAISSRSYLSKLVKIVSIDVKSCLSQVTSITSHKELRSLVLLPKHGMISQNQRGQYTCSLTDMSVNSDSDFLSLTEIQLITVEEPYRPMQLFGNLRKLEVALDFIQLPFTNHTVWPFLAELRLRGPIDMALLEEFLNHRSVRHLHLAYITRLKPLEPSPGHFDRLLRLILESKLSPDLTSKIMDRARGLAEDHDRSLLLEARRQVHELTNKEVAAQLQERIVTTFQELLEVEEKSIIEKMRLCLQESSQLKIEHSIEYYWEDDLAISGPL